MNINGYLNLINSGVSYKGKYIRENLEDIVSGVFGEYNTDDYLALKEFYNHYINANIARFPIRNEIYYFIVSEQDINNKKVIKLRRDKVLSPKKEPEQIPNTNKIPKVISTISNTKESHLPNGLIRDYYDKRYNNPMCYRSNFTLTEDDVICLSCGYTMDDSLSDVPDLNYHLTNYVCPNCKNSSSNLAIYDKQNKWIRTIFRC